MKKLLLRLLKYGNHYANDRLTPKEEAKTILKYLLLKNSTTHSIEIFEALEIAMKAEMLKREVEASAVCRAVNSKWKIEKQPTYMEILVKDPIFEKPLN